MDPLLRPFFERSASAPDRPACLAPGRSVTVGELHAAVDRDATRLAELRAAPDSIAAFVCPNGPAFLSGYAALRRAGHPVLLVDSTTPAAEQERIAARLGAGLLWRAADGWWNTEPACVRLAGGGSVPRGTAALKLTSGSSGEPSGVAVSGENLVADARALERVMGFGPDDRLLVSVPMSHSYGFSVLTSPAYLLGTPLLFHDGSDPLGVARELGATFLASVPSWYRAIAEVSGAGDWPECLRLLVSAGAPLPADVARAFRERFGLPIHAFYGSSECGGITYDRRGDAAERGSVGEPVEGVRVTLSEEEEGRGVVTVESAAVALGYVPPRADDPPRLAGGRFTTEDLASLRDGELFLHGRTSEWINVKGKKVRPREVESVLSQLDGVREVVVVAQPVPGTDGAVVRSVIAAPDRALGYREVVDWCRARLPRHKVPRSVIVVDEIPRNGRGKVDRAALLALTPED